MNDSSLIAVSYAEESLAERAMRSMENAWGGTDEWPVEDTKPEKPTTPDSYAVEEAKRSVQEMIGDLKEQAEKTAKEAKRLEELEELDRLMAIGAPKTTTSDPNHWGYYGDEHGTEENRVHTDIKPVKWIPLKTECEPC